MLRKVTSLVLVLVVALFAFGAIGTNFVVAQDDRPALEPPSRDPANPPADEGGEPRQDTPDDSEPPRDRPDEGQDEGEPPRDRPDDGDDGGGDDNGNRDDDDDDDDDDGGGDSAPPPPPPAETTSGIFGTVTDVCLNAPGAGLQITINGTTVTTDENGNYSLTGLGPGDYSITLQLPSDFSPGNTSATVTLNGSNVATVDLTYCSTGPFPAPAAATPPELPTAGGLDPGANEDLYYMLGGSDAAWLMANANLWLVASPVENATLMTPFPQFVPLASCEGHSALPFLLEPGQVCLCGN